MKKKRNLISIISVILGLGYVLEEYLLPYKYSFLLPLALFLFVLNFILFFVFMFEYAKTKDRNLLWGGILFFSIFFKETGVNLLKIINQ